MRRLVCFFLILLLLPFSLTAQTQPQNPAPPPSPSPAPSPAPPPESEAPVPYEPDEFPGWSRRLRRAEIITLGLFPFAFLFSSLAYDIGRYSMHNYDSRYAPGPFGSADKVSRSASDTRNVILISISLSALLAVVDLIIEENKPQRTR